MSAAVAAGQADSLREITARHLGAERLERVLAEAVGGGVRVEVQREGELLGVTYRLDAGNLFTLYRREGEKWGVVFAPELGGREAPQFGGTLLAVPEWDGANLAVELLGLDGTPRRLFRWEGAAKEYQLGMDADGFRMEILDASRDPLRGCCEAFPYRYSVQANRVVRIQPIGFDPRQFLEAWLRAPWGEVASFTEPAARGRLRAAQAREQGPGAYGAIEACDDLAKLWQVSLHGSAYFLIERTGTWHFRLRDVRTEPMAGCSEGKEYPWLRTMFAEPLRF